MDKDGYPTKQELRRIKNWKQYDLYGLARYICGLWYYPDRARIYKGKDILGNPIKKLYLSTGGWSGNEEIIGVLQNTFFWFVCWQKSEKGGHYWFNLPKWSKELKSNDK